MVIPFVDILKKQSASSSQLYVTRFSKYAMLLKKVANKLKFHLPNLKMIRHIMPVDKA